MSEDEKRVSMSYEVLYELVRREKIKKELQPLSGDFLKHISEYLVRKEIDYQDASNKNDFFSIGERDKLHVQLQNIKRLIKELHERREKKIVDMALNRSKLSQDLVDTTHLLPPERLFYDQMLSQLSTFRSSGILHVMMPATPPEPKGQPQMKCIRFLSDIPEFVGSAMEPYGPFEENQTATLPTDVAEVLISQGNAREEKAQ